MCLTEVICFCPFLKQFFLSVGIAELVYLTSCHLQIICSCCFLYLLRRLKLISFHLSESLATPDNFKTFVPLKTLIDTLPVAVTYLLYMVIALVLHFYAYYFLESQEFASYQKILCGLWFSLKASHDGVCSRSKCTHVYNP